MRPAVNFMPWRQLQRRRCLRFWAAIAVASVVSLSLSGALWHTQRVHAGRSGSLWLAADRLLLAALHAQEEPLRLRRQQWQLAQEKARRRQITAAWRQTLLTLAAALPENAWLTQLRWRQNQLEIHGLARAVNALGEFEPRLQKLAGFHLQPMGSASRDGQGLWQFTYQLSREQVDVAKP
ncbi:fimbrial assembly protein [Kosakonia cowanii]|jgi:pilus assembly protein HofN|uniref:PilN domain-containing protein n=1 Tax=Kosakonia cowanii TaxID=208223 RepID=UPI000B9710EB|nr:PilN domain-containing protein [Kosakonia cowanii]AST71142.1 fimbrial assembly protein [Kosakonia cowanii]